MEYYDGYDNQGYQDPYAQDPYGYGGYDGYYDEYGNDTFQADGSPPPPSDKDWEDPVNLNRSYLESIQKDVVLDEYKGLNDQNMYLVEVLVSDFEIKNEIADSKAFKDKRGKDFFTSVKILHYPFLEVSEGSIRDTKLLRTKSKSERLPSYTDLFQTVYTESDPRISVASGEQTEDHVDRNESVLESIRDTLKESITENKSTVKEEENEKPEKQTKSYTLEMGKNIMFTMTGLAMLQTLMKHEIRVRLSERVTVNVTDPEVNNSQGRTSTERSRGNSTVEWSTHDSPKNSRDSQRKSVASHGPETPSLSDDVTISVEGATLGTASVRLSGLYHQAVLEAARPVALPPFHAPGRRTEEYYPLNDSEGEEIGMVGLSIHLTCLGRAAVNCVRETLHKGYEFEHTLLLNKERFEPPKKVEEPPKMDARLARYLLKLGPVIPAPKTSTDILQECLDKNLIQDNNDCTNTHKSKTDCDWSMMARSVQLPPVSERTTEETVSDLEPEIGQYLNTRWIDLKRICRELGEATVENEWGESKENSLYKRLEEMKMPVDDTSDVKSEIEIENNEGISQHRKCSLATSRSNSSSLKSNASRKRTI